MRSHQPIRNNVLSCCCPLCAPRVLRADQPRAVKVRADQPSFFSTMCTCPRALENLGVIIGRRCMGLNPQKDPRKRCYGCVGMYDRRSHNRTGRPVRQSQRRWVPRQAPCWSESLAAGCTSRAHLPAARLQNGTTHGGPSKAGTGVVEHSPFCATSLQGKNFHPPHSRRFHRQLRICPNRLSSN